MGSAQLRRHGKRVIEICEAAVRVEGSGVEDALGGLLDLGLLVRGGGGPGEVVVDYFFE